LVERGFDKCTSDMLICNNQNVAQVMNDTTTSYERRYQYDICYTTINQDG